MTGPPGANGSAWHCAWPGSCSWRRARRPAKCLSVPNSITRVPGAKGWVRGLANVRGQLLPIIDMKQFIGSGVAVLSRNTRIVVVNHREIPAGPAGG